MTASKLTHYDAAAVADVIGQLAKLDPAPDSDYYLSTADRDGIRLWHFDGYSPGFFDLEDGFWMFTADYLETP